MNVHILEDFKMKEVPLQTLIILSEDDFMARRALKDYRNYAYYRITFTYRGAPAVKMNLVNRNMIGAIAIPFEDLMRDRCLSWARENWTEDLLKEAE